ncbi:MAG: 2-oxoglutarate dehydrogenase E1 component [Myxococcales bacterium]|nr:2-oxoglutarate dehydrogenase E1 component [Myxococcales bacterium]
MMAVQDTFLSGSNIDFIEALYARYLEEPSSVDESWRRLFSGLERGGRPIFADGRRIAVAAPTAEPAMGLQARMDQAIYAFRLRGHLLARLDPLGRGRPVPEEASKLEGDPPFSPAELETEVDSAGVFPESRVRVGRLLVRLRRTYCEHLGIEFMHLLDGERRRWLEERMERSENRTALSSEDKRWLLQRVTRAETFEGFLHTKYVGAKRFSLEGAESLVPMVEAFLETAGELGVREVVVGMAHRGRLNLLANVFGKPLWQLFAEFEPAPEPSRRLHRGDVRYHLGYSGEYRTRQGRPLHLSLAFNPSHLEAVYPVVEGRVRARQDRAGGDHSHTVPLAIHGDAAFAAQGAVAETLNLAFLPGYSTGGTIHLIIDNQIGFTTAPEQGRSSRYCTAVAQLLEVPIFHVNGDDPEACLHAMRLAAEFRQRFESDVVVDLFCFRRYGHNEADEPSFTQPEDYQLIRAHPSVRKLYAQQLEREGQLPSSGSEAVRQACLKELEQAHRRQRSGPSRPSSGEGVWRGMVGGPDTGVPQPDTGVPLARLRELLRRVTSVPEGFTPHPKVRRLLELRREMAEGRRLDFATAEALAFASLLEEGYSLRLTGQDTERGTFSQRHAVLHDVETGARYLPLEHVSEAQGSCTILNSPLSELGCLGFELGYSFDAPHALVAWEAQFGDFVNSAQVVIDQFIAASESKWRRLSGLTLLLPHGYEGQGPEHSSARLERFLELCAEDNLQVCCPTTPAQYFHLLRRQLLRPLRKPLVVMTPKSLLRLQAATSAFEELGAGRFVRLLPDREATPEKVRRLLLCSGKLYYDLRGGRQGRESSIALVRLEQLYPLPLPELGQALRALPRLEEVFWVQEEPRNQGAWRHVIEPLQQLCGGLPSRPRLGYIGREESASTATGFHDTHLQEQRLVVEEAMALGATT